MWVEIKNVEGLKVAEDWKELFEEQGVPTRILPSSGVTEAKGPTTYLVLVPGDKVHLIEEVLRKL
jgi:hypothetical protein